MLFGYWYVCCCYCCCYYLQLVLFSIQEWISMPKCSILSFYTPDIISCRALDVKLSKLYGSTKSVLKRFVCFASAVYAVVQCLSVCLSLQSIYTCLSIQDAVTSNHVFDCWNICVHRSVIIQFVQMHLSNASEFICANSFILVCLHP